MKYLERAKEAYDRVENLKGTLDCLDKKATIFRARGEERLAKEMERMYDARMQEAQDRQDEMLGRNV